MNKKLLIGLAILIVGGVFVAYALTGDHTKELAPVPAAGSAEQQAAMHEQFPNLPASNRFVVESTSQIMDRFYSGTGIIFLGFKECPWCQKMAPIINEAAETGGATIYYIDIRRLSEDAPSDYQALITGLLPYLPKNAAGQPQISTPDISFVRNGEIIWRYEMDATTEAERTPDAYWTDARKERALKQFDEHINEMRKEE